MVKLWQFLQGRWKPAFSEKVERGDQEKFFKNRQTSSAGFKNPTALWRTWHYSLISMHLKCKEWRRFGAKGASKSTRKAKLWQFSQINPKPAFSEKVPRGDQGKFFKNHPKSSPRLKGQKALWRKWHYPLISMHFKSKNWRRFWRKRRLTKCPNGQVMALFAR